MSISLTNIKANKQLNLHTQNIPQQAVRALNRWHEFIVALAGMVLYCLLPHSIAQRRQCGQTGFSRVGSSQGETVDSQESGKIL